MAIKKMKLVNLVCNTNDFDKVAEQYITAYDFHLENALFVLNKIKHLEPFSETENYQAAKDIIKNFMSAADIDSKTDYVKVEINDIDQTVKDINSKIDTFKKKQETLSQRISDNSLVLENLEPMINTNVNLDQLIKFEFIKFRFGRIPVNTFKTLETYLSDLDAIFVSTNTSDGYVWGFYFTPATSVEKIDSVFASLCFERIRFTDRIAGNPKETYDAIKQETKTLKQELSECETDIKNEILLHKDSILSCYWKIVNREKYSVIIKNAAHTQTSTYLVGWLAEDECAKLMESVKSDDTIMCLVEEPEENPNVKPPTVLKNNRFFRPFEMFVKMYGLPAYGEIDPTPILAITYMLFFGMMFGDVGQGIVLSIGGFLLNKFKKMDIAAIVGRIGITSALFGVVYGSVFGNETWLENIRLIEPMHDIMFVLIASIGFGVFIIIITMILNIINGIRSKETASAVFSQNGIAGMVFYVSAIFVALFSLLYSGNKKIPGIVIAILIGVPVLMIFLQEPLKNLVQKKKNWLPKEFMFYLESFFELFEIMLSYITNTVSFVRIGAFALNHVGMMGVVAIFANMSNGNPAVYVIGNIVVIGLEGLIVGIQVLRLEFYEMFNRFYRGGGIEFKSLDNMINK